MSVCMHVCVCAHLLEIAFFTWKILSIFLCLLLLFYFNFHNISFSLFSNCIFKRSFCKKIITTFILSLFEKSSLFIFSVMIKYLYLSHLNFSFYYIFTFYSLIFYVWTCCYLFQVVNLFIWKQFYMLSYQLMLIIHWHTHN